MSSAPDVSVFFVPYKVSGSEFIPFSAVPIKLESQPAHTISCFARPGYLKLRRGLVEYFSGPVLELSLTSMPLFSAYSLAFFFLHFLPCSSLLQ